MKLHKIPKKDTLTYFSTKKYYTMHTKNRVTLHFFTETSTFSSGSFRFVGTKKNPYRVLLNMVQGGEVRGKVLSAIVTALLKLNTKQYNGNGNGNGRSQRLQKTIHFSALLSLFFSPSYFETLADVLIFTSTLKKISETDVMQRLATWSPRRLQS